MPIPDHLKGESESFDNRMKERISHGLIPDLRRAGKNNWFYNNPWRHPDYVDMIFGEYFRFCLRNIPLHSAKVLEVGCGPGHISLELARNGFHVTGLELSKVSLEIAEKMKAENPYLENFGSLTYEHSDLFEWQHEPHSFDTVCFILTLHHFENIQKVFAKTNQLLKPGGRIIVIEPARDWINQREASIIATIRLLLSSSGQWYEDIHLPTSQDELDQYVHSCLVEYQEARDHHEQTQSPNDNSSFAQVMLDELRSQYTEVDYKEGMAFIPRMIGGVRGKDETHTLSISKLMSQIDQYLVENEIVSPGVFFFAGEKSR